MITPTVIAATATGTASDGGASGTYLRALGTVTPSGLSNFEASGKGAFRLVIAFSGGAGSDVISINVEEDGSVATNCVFGVSSASNTGAVSPVDLTTSTTLRIEFSSTAIRTYANNTLVMDAGFGATGNILRASTYHGFSGTSPSGNFLLDNISGTSAVLLNYVNYQLNASTGPLGPPGGAVVALTLPKLTLSAGQFAHGSAALSFFPLYVTGALPPVAPTFWSGYVGTREVP